MLIPTKFPLSPKNIKKMTVFYNDVPDTMLRKASSMTSCEVII